MVTCLLSFDDSHYRIVALRPRPGPKSDLLVFEVDRDCRMEQAGCLALYVSPISECSESVRSDPMSLHVLDSVLDELSVTTVEFREALQDQCGSLRLLLELFPKDFR